MIKKINLILFGLFFAFVFINNVYAFSGDLSTTQLDTLSDEVIIELNDFLNNISDEYNLNLCFLGLAFPNQYNIFCFYNNDYFFIDGYSFLFVKRDVDMIRIIYKLDGNYELNYISHTSSYDKYYGLILSSSSYSSFPLWADNLVYKSEFGNIEYSFSDEAYSSLPDNLKTYYTFQDYLKYDYPLYSYINLRLGNYQSDLVTEIDYTINYYYDDVLQESLTENLIGSNGEVIELNNLELVKDNIYFLDESKDYSITLTDGQANIINVYYYSKDISYSVNVYLDDIYYQSHSYTSIDKVGREIVMSELSETINIYTLDEREYKVLLSENQETNYINVYYYSENYETKYQDIDTSDKFYIAFDWVYIKDLFKLNGLYTQTEQFVIVYVVNFLFYAIVCIFGYFGLKMINKLFSLFRMF